ncbi:MAG: hypothetical protein PHH68_00690 [Candidatus Omnitrophica bacterium]|jgi:hypothetical protein|nr:hypothetical protein [Candidatus Omnitrophota bacterium]MDD5078825.1 hypothetical protein [Candidatus Omnitrophota bacterium]
MRILVSLVCLLFVFVLKAFAACDECEMPTAAMVSTECVAAKLNCIAACKTKEAAEISAKASDNMAQAQQKTIEVLKETFIVAQQTAELLDKLIQTLNENNPKPAAQQ